MNQVVRDVDLLAKQRPRQERAKRTYETILSSAAELLVEVGVERISTNLIAERAGVTVPALYRYFPNKYAVVHTLGLGLMERQNEAFRNWLENVLEEHGPEGLLPRIEDGLLAIYCATRDQVAGIEIFHALRAMAPLREQRQAARTHATDFLIAEIGKRFGLESSAELRLRARLTVDMSCSLVEIALEDGSEPVEILLREGAAMIRAYWAQAI